LRDAFAEQVSKQIWLSTHFGVITEQILSKLATISNLNVDPVPGVVKEIPNQFSFWRNHKTLRDNVSHLNS
jgi:hypothetical protein